MRTNRGRRSREHERRLANVLSELKPSAWAAVAAALVALVMMTVLSTREHPDDARLADEFPPEDVEAATIRVMPYRRSGLIFSWGNAEPAIRVDRVLWDALPRTTQEDLGQATAIAKNVRVVRLFDSKTNVLIATCTAAGRCREAGAAEPESVSAPAGRSSPQRSPVAR